MELTNIDVIKLLLNKHGFRFSKSMGQNFLTQSWVPEDIADSAGIDEMTGVLEIGPGIGCLTRELSQRAGRVVAVELDTALKPMLAETLPTAIIPRSFLRTCSRRISRSFYRRKCPECATLCAQICRII